MCPVISKPVFRCLRPGKTEATILRPARYFRFRIYQLDLCVYYLGSEKQRCRSDCADAQADLRLCCSHKAKTGFLMN